MTDDRPFFNAEIDDQLVNSLDSLAFAELLQVLQLNFLQEHQQLTKLTDAKTGLIQEIKVGEGNLARLGSLSTEHQRQRLKLVSELQLLEAECEAAKQELRQKND